MKLSIVISALLTTTVSAAAIPEAASVKGLEARQETGSYTISDLGARKQQVTAAGASSFNMAIAMLETERMDTNVRYLPQPLYSESLHLRRRPTHSMCMATTSRTTLPTSESSSKTGVCFEYAVNALWDSHSRAGTMALS